MQVLDPRLVQIDVAIGARVYSFNGDLAIFAQGTLFANPLMDVADVIIMNLDRATQDFLLTATSPYSAIHERKTVTIRAGRQSYGLQTIYKGDILVSKITQPPDIGVAFSVLTALNFANTMYNISFPGTTQIEVINEKVAEVLGALPVYQVQKPQYVQNFHYSGSANQILSYVNIFGNAATFFTDGDTPVLYMMDFGIPLKGSIRDLNEDTGMIGVPEFTEWGIKVTYLIDRTTVIGGGLRIKSQRYPVFNGDYYIFKLGFNIASRDTPFYYIAEAVKVGLNPGEGYSILKPQALPES